jgi:hypothetical protein
MVTERDYRDLAELKEAFFSLPEQQRLGALSRFSFVTVPSWSDKPDDKEQGRILFRILLGSRGHECRKYIKEAKSAW